MVLKVALFDSWVRIVIFVYFRNREKHKKKNNVLPPTTNTCLYIDVSRYILVSRYIHAKIGINGQRELKNLFNTSLTKI
jgi:hypothetical protein